MRFYARYFGPKVLRISLALGVAVLLHQFLKLSYLDYLTYDVRTRFSPTTEASELIQTISVDAASIKNLKRTPDLKDHIRFLEKLSQTKPQTIIYRIKPDELKGSPAEKLAFATLADKLPLIVAVDDLPLKGQEHELLLDEPFEHLVVLPAPHTADSAIFAKDGVTRRIIVSFQGRPTMHTIVAGKFNNIADYNDYQGLFPFYDSQQVLIDYRPTGTYQPFSFHEVLEGKAQISSGKILIVGAETFNTEDYVSTPLSRSPTAMTRLEMTANMIDTLIQNSAPRWAHPYVNLALTAMIAMLTILFIFYFSPISGLIALFTTMASFIILSYVLFITTGIALGMAHPLLAMFICYYFFVPYRLIMENRKSWEYQQKNKLLTQVEELKSNFLRMMSHDLKTPLARIQGMADIVLKDSDHLSPEQKEAVKTINNSSEELTDFIGGILNLGRIEGKEIKLQLKSKDVNNLLKDVISNCEFLARKKNITFILDFEPMFSIQIDEDLMRQVFTNLVENAIKYSPKNSKVMITTEEHDGVVVVQVADQGVGIDKDEQENVFVKFYRSKKVVNTDIKGSGLGLYLSQYFVNLHSGHIDVESEPGKGSTFSVILPMDESF